MTDGNVASKGNDNYPGSCWMAADGNTNHWWMVDLGSTFAVKSSSITWMNAGTGYQYKIETSIDQSTWTLVADKTASVSLLQTQLDSYSTNARYIRVTITGGVSSLNKANIGEFRVFDGTTTTFSPTSITIQAIESSPNTGIHQPISEPAFLIYPNPVSTSFTLEMNGNRPTPELVEIYNSMGQKVMSYRLEKYQNRLQIPVTGFSTGIYYIKVNNNSQKFMVMKS